MSEGFYHEITDKQWEIIEPNLPKQKSTGRRNLDARKIFNAIYWKAEQNVDIYRKNTGTGIAFTINIATG